MVLRHDVDKKIGNSLKVALLEHEMEIKSTFYFRYSSNEFDNLFPKIRLAEFRNLPIKNIEFNNQVV